MSFASATAKNTAAVASPLITVSPTQSLTNSRLNDFSRRWLSGVPCSPPCWENITPGKTNIEQALQAIKNLSSVTNFKLVEDNSSTAEIFWDWKWNDQKMVGFIYFRTFSKNGSKLVSKIAGGYSDQVQTDHKPITLDEVIKVYGEPEYVGAKTGNANFEPPVPVVPTYTLYLVYAKKGFSFTFYGRSKPEINGTMVIINPIFFSPDALNDITPEKITFLPWEGYKDFLFYCRSEGTKPCNL